MRARRRRADVQGIVVGHSDPWSPPARTRPAASCLAAAVHLAPTVANQGTDPAPASTTSFFSREHQQLAREERTSRAVRSVPLLASRSEREPAGRAVAVPGYLPGTYFVQACSRRAERRAGSVETNNCLNAAGTMTVQVVQNLVRSADLNPPSDEPRSAGSSTSRTRSGTSARSPRRATGTKYYLVSILTGRSRT